MLLRRSILHARLRDGKPIWCYKTNIPHPMMPELFGSRGVDCLWLDCEHFPSSTDAMFLLIQACRGSDTDSLVRVPNGQFALAAKMLDTGADAIMYPRCRDADEIRELIEWTCFPPIGRRGADTGVAAAGFSALSVDEHIRRATRHSTLAVQIETLEALEAVDAIAAVDGVDLLFLGPGDLSVAMGVECDPDQPALADAARRVAEAAAAHGLAWGMPAFTLDHVRRLLERGALLIAYASDTSTLAREIVETRKQFEALGVAFGDAD